METLRKTSTAIDRDAATGRLIIGKTGTLYLAPLLWVIFLPSPGIADQSQEVNGEVAFRSAVACGACHARVYDEWSESWMARSYSNATFQAIYIQAGIRQAKCYDYGARLPSLSRPYRVSVPRRHRRACRDLLSFPLFLEGKPGDIFL